MRIVGGSSATNRDHFVAAGISGALLSDESPRGLRKVGSSQSDTHFRYSTGIAEDDPVKARAVRQLNKDGNFASGGGMQLSPAKETDADETGLGRELGRKKVVPPGGHSSVILG